MALLLNQQKAKERVHFDCHRQLFMKDFNIPDDTIISSLISLFSSTMIQINVNRFLTDAFQQHGELRQGDSISPLLLFNIAFDPLLRAIDNSPAIQKLHFFKVANHSSAIPTTGLPIYSQTLAPKPQVTIIAN